MEEGEEEAVTLYPRRFLGLKDHFDPLVPREVFCVSFNCVSGPPWPDCQYFLPSLFLFAPSKLNESQSHFG